MSSHWILDKEESPQGFPLGKLIGRVREIIGTSPALFYIRRSQGYGATICHWDELLDEVPRLSVMIEELEQLCSGTEEWFYYLDVLCVAPSGDIEFGIHDSTALFLNAPDQVAKTILAGFNEVRVEQQ